MRKVILSTVAAGALALATLPASAMPSAQPLPLASGDQPSVTLVSGGCGPFRHRGWNGFCYPGGGGYGWGGYGWGGYGYGWHRPWGWGGYGWHRPWGWHRW